MSLFKTNKNWDKVENPYCSLGLLQRTTMISSADHYDLSVVCQAEAYRKSLVNKKRDLCSLWGRGCRRTYPTLPPYGPHEVSINKVHKFMRYLSQRVLNDRWGSFKFLQWFTQILAQHSNDKTVLRIIQRRTKRRQTAGKIEVWNYNDTKREEMNKVKTCQAYHVQKDRWFKLTSWRKNRSIFL